jgi:uncharacterized OB-fold protein
MTTPVKIHRNKKRTSDLIGKRGKIVVWTIIRVAAKLFSKQAPYPVVIVRLENKSQIIGQLVDWQDEDLQIGREVVAVLRCSGTEDKEGVIAYSIKFKPL